MEAFAYVLDKRSLCSRIFWEQVALFRYPSRRRKERRIPGALGLRPVDMFDRSRGWLCPHLAGVQDRDRPPSLDNDIRHRPLDLSHHEALRLSELGRSAPAARRDKELSLKLRELAFELRQPLGRRQRSNWLGRWFKLPGAQIGWGGRREGRQRRRGCQRARLDASTAAVSVELIARRPRRTRRWKGRWQSRRGRPTIYCPQRGRLQG